MNPKESILSLTNLNDIVKYLNVRKDPIDLRDKMFQSYLFRNEEDLPTQVDLRDRMSEVVHQLQYSSCTAKRYCIRIT